MVIMITLLLSVIISRSLSSDVQCPRSLGMEDGRIADNQITASSTYQDTLVGPNKGRLNSEAGGGAWCPRDAIGGKEGKEEFLEIDLLVDHIIHSVVTQGRFANGLGQEYVDQYTLQFWREGTDNFMDYLDGEVLQGNTNTYQAVEHVLHGPSVIASKIRIIPHSSHPRTVCLRVEITGCRYNGMLQSSNNNETSVDTSSEWEEEAFLGSAVGILVTVILAAIAAVTMVLVRNQRQKRNLEEFGNFSTCSSIKSALEKENHPDVIPWEKRSQRDADSFIINMGGNIYANNYNLSLPSPSNITRKFAPGHTHSQYLHQDRRKGSASLPPKYPRLQGLPVADRGKEMDPLKNILV